MPVLVEKVGDRIWLRFPPGFVPKPVFDKRRHQAESVVGASFRKADKVYTYPLDMTICRDLRTVFGDELQIGKELRWWAAGQVAREAALKPLLTAHDLPDDDFHILPKRAPRIWEAISDPEHRYQRPAIMYCVLARQAQNASQPGLGKTIETLGTIVESGTSGLVLVAAPKTALRTVWEPEVQQWLPGTPVFAATGSKGRRTDTLAEAMRAWDGGKHSLVFVVINPEMLRTRKIEECGATPPCDLADKQQAAEHEDLKHRTINYYEHDYPILFERDWAAFIVDETHRYILNVNLRTKKATLTGTGAMLLPMKADPLKLALSGTPWKGKPKNAWSIGHWLFGDVGLNAGFWNWAYRMLKVTDNGYGKVIGDVGDTEAFNRWCDNFMIRHTKAEMAAWLPPKTYGGTHLIPADQSSPIGVWLEMDGPQAKAYKDMETNAAAALDSGRLIADGILAELTRLKQFASSHGDVSTRIVRRRVKGEMKEFEVLHFDPKMPSNKIETILEMLEERGITGDEDDEGESKVVIASQFTQMINLLSGELKRKSIHHYVLTGETSDKNREAYVRQFQTSNAARVFLLNTMAGGVAVTLDAADDLIFMDETFVPDDQEQAEDRLHRTSKAHNVTIYYLRTRGTIDERIAYLTQAKDDAQKLLLDGKRGVALAKKLVGGES